MNTRRQFLIKAPLGVLAATAACRDASQPEVPGAPASASNAPPGALGAATTPGTPPTFATAPSAGPPVSHATFAEAEKLMQVEMTPAERQQAADSWRSSMAQYFERRTGPRTVALTDADAPATVWNPSLPGVTSVTISDRFVRSVSNAPGSRLLIVTLCATVLRAIPATKPVSPARAPFESPSTSIGAFTELDVMFTMRPKPRFIMPSTVALMNSIGVSMLASTALIQSSRVQSRKSPKGGPPAFVTRISGAGHAASARARPDSDVASAITRCS